MLTSATSLHVPGRPLFAAALLFLSLLPAKAIGQVAGSYGHPDEQRIVHGTAPNTGILTFKVYAERNGTALGRQAVVKLVNLTTQTVSWQSTGDHSESVFTDVPYGNYSAEISAVGFLSEHRDLKMVPILTIQNFEIVIQRDPAAVNFDVADSIVSEQARKETKRAISSLKSGNLDDAQKHLDKARASAPSDPGVNFLLGYLYFQKNDFAQASNYLGTATNLNPHNAQALTLLGRADLEQKDYPTARTALEKAVEADSDNWLPHNLLADAYLHEKNYPKARDQAQIAITKGKNEASAAQLVLGEAFLNLGNNEEGIRALRTYLEESPRQPIAGQVRSLIAQVEDTQTQDAQVSDHAAGPNAAGETQHTETQHSPIRLSGVDPLLALAAPSLSMKSWQPPGIDDVKLTLAAGVSCPANIIEETGKRVQELVDDVGRIAAVEDMFHQALDVYGTPLRTETRKYNYVASISEPQPGVLNVDEFRNDKTHLSEYPDHIATNGFVTLALVFHPDMRDTFTMACEGLGDWRGQASWLVHFVQRDDRPNHMHSYKIGSEYRPVKLMGRAWITADKFQIVRIEAEMAKPMPEIQLASEHQVVEYGPIPFQQKNAVLWLPKSAEIYLDFRKHRYYRRHSFDHYMLFSTESNEKRGDPVIPPAKGL